MSLTASCSRLYVVPHLLHLLHTLFFRLVVFRVFSLYCSNLHSCEQSFCKVHAILSAHWKILNCAFALQDQSCMSLIRFLNLEDLLIMNGVPLQVGHQMVGAIAQCMGLPLFRRRIQGTARFFFLFSYLAPAFLMVANSSWRKCTRLSHLRKMEFKALIFSIWKQCK
jgi:hypothetical protein